MVRHIQAAPNHRIKFFYPFTLLYNFAPINSQSYMRYHIQINGYIGSWTKRMVHDLLNDYKDKHVDVAIDSLGGEVSAGLAICQMFKSHGDVTVDFQAGFSASAATICAMGAKKIRMNKYCLLLVHKCSSEQFVWSALNEEEIGTLIESLQKQQENQQKIDNIIANVYCDRSGKKHEDIVKVMSEAKWHTVEECIELGLVDESMDGKPAEITEHTQDFIKYNNLPVLPEIVNSWYDKKAGFLGRLFGKDSTHNNKVFDMIKKWTHINNVLDIEGIEAEETAKDCTISREQMQKIEDKFAADSNSIKTKEEEISKVKDEKKELETKVANLEKEKKDLEDKVKDLEGEPGGDTHTAVDDTKAQDYCSDQVLNALVDFA